MGPGIEDIMLTMTVGISSIEFNQKSQSIL